ncbi:MAG: inositol monophosphatase family protein, partial [Acidimicrobiales bacterium]
LKLRFLDQATAGAVAANRSRFAATEQGPNCAGVEYPLLALGEVDFSLYWRTLPWDHAPGVLLLQEAGGHAARPNGDPYRPADQGPGLLLAPDATSWSAVRDGLLSAP